MRTTMFVVTNLPSGHSDFSSTSTCRALGDELGRIGLGYPGAVELAGDEGLQGRGILLRLDLDVAAPLGCRS